MVIFAAAAMAAASALQGTYKYNRQNYFFDKNLFMKRGFQGFNMRIKQYELYRQDVRDLIGLTVRKMDNYLIVNTLQLGFCITLFTEGRPEPPEHEEGQHVDQEPRWLIGLYALCNGGAFMYYLMSIWLAMHASVAAHAFGVRLLTQFVRLPVPNDQQLDEAVRLAQDYEASGVSDMLRVPLLKQQFQNLARASNDATDAGADGADGGDSDDSASDLGSVGDDETSPVAKLHHVRLYRKLQANWQSYDAYSRVCMALGTNQLLHAISYTCLGQLEETQDGWWPACHCVVVFTTTAWVIARLDLFLSRRFLAFAAILLFLPPALAIVSLYLKNSPKPGMLFVGKCVVPVIYALHIIWIVFTLGIAKAKEREGVALPTNYRSVLYLDVFRWLTRENGEEEPDPDGVGVPGDGAARANRVSSRDENVDFVLVGDGSAGEGRGARTRESVPPQYWRVSLQECLSGCPPLDAELQLWAGEGVRAQLRLDDPPAVERADRLRERLQRLRAELDRLAAAAAPPGAGAGPAGGSSSSSAGGRRRPPPERQAPQAPPPAAGPGDPAVWLLVQQQRGGRAVRQYYLNSITRERSSEQPAGPAGPAPVSTLADLEQRLDCLEDFAARLRPPGAASSSSSPAAAAPRTAAASPADSDADTQPRAVERTATTMVREAMADFGVVSGQQSERQARRRRHKQPGFIPWNTVVLGSCVLMLAWASGLVASIHRVWEHKDREERFAALAVVGVALGESAEAPPLLAAPAALPAAWPPHAFFRWGGLACHPGLAGGTAEGGPRLLAAEKYAVHELRLHASTAGMQSMESGGSLAEAVRRCLDQAPGFHGGGIADVSLACPVEEAPSGRHGSRACAALVLASSGREALRCPLEDGAPRPAAAQRLRLRGGPWRALAPAGTGALWALLRDPRAAAAPVQLRPVPGSAEAAAGLETIEMQPQLDLPPATAGRSSVGAAAPTRLLALDGGALLAVGEEGALHAWSPGGGRPRTWRLGAAADGAVRWSGLCAAGGGELLLAGQRPGGGGAPGLWRARLPLGLLAAGAA